MNKLKERVDQFNMLQLPGQPRAMHMGTSYLVNDLFNAIKSLEAERDALQMHFDKLEKTCKNAMERCERLEGAVSTLKKRKTVHRCDMELLEQALEVPRGKPVLPDTVHSSIGDNDAPW